MLRKNFPTRKNERRKEALRLLQKQIKDRNHKPKRFKDIKPTKAQILEYEKELSTQIKVVEKRINDGVANA